MKWKALGLTGIVICIALLVPTMLFAKTELTVEINGVSVASEANHIKKDGIYVDVDVYTRIVNKSYSFDQRKNTVTIGNTTIKATTRSGIVTALVDDLAKATGAEEVTHFSDSYVYVLDLPEGAVKYHPIIPGMGQHWIVPAGQDIDDINFRITTIYGSYKGKLTFIEQMIDQEFFVNATDADGHLQLAGMEGLPAPSIQHTDIDFQPTGHAGFEVPHFDIHHYYVTHEEHMAITGEEEHH